MMNPKALEALRQARELFRQPSEIAKDDIPDEVTQVFSEPIRKPRVVLLPPNAPKFDQHSIKEEHKKMEQQKQNLKDAQEKIKNGHSSPKQIDKYVGMSVKEATEACFKKGIKKPMDIAKETGKNVKQIYTAVWKIKMDKRKARSEAKEAKKYEWSGEPVEFVAPKSLEKVAKQTADISWYAQEITRLMEENIELKAVIKYLERKANPNV